MTQRNSSKRAKSKLVPHDMHKVFEHRETQDYPKALPSHPASVAYPRSSEYIRRQFGDVINHCRELSRRAHFDEE